VKFYHPTFLISIGMPFFGLPVTPFLCQGIGAGSTALYDGDGPMVALVTVEGAPDQVAIVIDRRRPGFS
jgi:hypothetical protein